MGVRALLLILLIQGCTDERVIPLPEVQDYSFVVLQDVALGVEAAFVERRRSSLEVSPEGLFREPYRGGWITYAFLDASTYDRLVVGPRGTLDGPTSLFGDWRSVSRGPRGPSRRARLAGIEWRAPQRDSTLARKRLLELVERITRVLGEPTCQTRSGLRRDVSLALWPGVPAAEVFSAVVVSGDGQTHESDIVIRVQIQSSSAEATTRPEACEFPIAGSG